MVQYLQESSFANNAATVAETSRSPSPTTAYDLKNATVVTIAHFIKATSDPGAALVHYQPT